MFIDFEKWHGAKNDFVILWILHPDRDLIVPTLQRLAPKICNRDGSGIGADGLLVLITKNRKDPFAEELVIVNSDGSLAKNCGNGLRCAASSARLRAHREGILDFDGITLTVQGKPINCRFLGDSDNPMVAVAMASPELNTSNSWHAEVHAMCKQLQRDHGPLNGELETVSLGNPHVVFFVNDASKKLAEIAGQPLQAVRSGDGINVHIASNLDITDQDQQLARRDIGEPLGELLKVFPWERGVGLTQACGTGACAVGVAVLDSGLVDRSEWVGVDMPGGRLYVKQSTSGDDVILAGPAKFVFSGSLEI